MQFNPAVSRLDFTVALSEFDRKMDGVYEGHVGDVEAGVGVDPFAVALEMQQYGIDFATWKTEFEPRRRWQKTMMNHIGDLQQDLVAQFDGWTSHHPGAGVAEPDLVGRIGERKVIVELKNAKNTLNSASAKGTYQAMSAHLDGKYTGFIGIVVGLKWGTDDEPKYRRFAPGRANVGREDLLEMGGRTFYALVTDPRQQTPPLVLETPAAVKWKESWGSLDEIAVRFFAEWRRHYGVDFASTELRDLMKAAYVS